MVTKVLKSTAETIYINHAVASYGIFCYNKEGDLFLNSDWGFYGFAWRSYGDNFKEFLASLNSEYVVGKFETNYIDTTKKRLDAKREAMLRILAEAFINELKKELVQPQV